MIAAPSGSALAPGSAAATSAAPVRTVTVTASAPAGSGSGFSGADVDGLDRVAAECRKAAQVCDEVRMVCEAIVAAASFFGPFGAAFIAYLKGVVIPWLKRISQALTLFAKVLSAHSLAQRDASSAATSLPSYVTPSSLPASNTSDYPTLPASAGAGGFAVSIDTPSGHAELVYTPASVTSSPNSITSAGAGGTLTPAAPSAVTNTGAALGAPITSGTDTSVNSPVSAPSATGDSVAPATLGSTALSPVDTTQQPASPTLGTGGQLGSVGDAASPANSGAGTHGGGSGGGSGGGYSGGAGSALGAGTSLAPSTADTATTAAPSIGSTESTLGGACTTSEAANGTSAGAHDADGGHVSHDGLYSGLGQATGIGAGAAAIAKSALTQSRQNGGDSLVGTMLLPSDGGADGAVQAQIFGGELG